MDAILTPSSRVAVSATSLLRVRYLMKYSALSDIASPFDYKFVLLVSIQLSYSRLCLGHDGVNLERQTSKTHLVIIATITAKYKSNVA